MLLLKKWLINHPSDTTITELLAIYFCVKQNEVEYLMNSNFISYCDPKPLVNLKAFKNILSK